jgi:hypothetical protein
VLVCGNAIQSMAFEENAYSSLFSNLSVQEFVALHDDPLDIQVADLAPLCEQYLTAMQNYFASTNAERFTEMEEGVASSAHEAVLHIFWQDIPSSREALYQKIRDLQQTHQMTEQWRLLAGWKLFIWHDLPNPAVALDFFIAVMYLAIANPGRVFFIYREYVFSFDLSPSAMFGRFSPATEQILLTIAMKYPVAYFDNDYRRLSSVDVVTDTRGYRKYKIMTVIGFILVVALLR